MAEDNNIKSFTAADIEKYHRGLLTSKEKHDLEKAALDDPFLADALEGYATLGISISADIADLKNRLAERTEQTPVIPLDKERRKFSPLLRIAAIVVILLGAGIPLYQFAFNNKKTTEIAQNKPEGKAEYKSGEVTKADTGGATGTINAENKNTAPGSGTTATTTAPETKPAVPSDNISDKNDVVSKDKETTPAVTRTDADREKVNQPAGNLADAKTIPATGGAPVNPSPIKDGEPQKVTERGIAVNDALEENKRKVTAAKKQQPATETTRGLGDDEDEGKGRRSVASSDQAVATGNGYYRDQAMNTFRGRVTDQNNTGLPFANVTNTRDNVGTYTDANGNFVLTSTDSVLNLQVRSLGYDNSNIQLRGNTANNKVVMQEDRSFSQIVLDNRKPNAALRNQLDSNRKLTEPAPADGWVKYDSYLANNINVPDDFKEIKSSANNSVQVSFEVDKNGEPVNIKVEKSLCNTCDKEAIRLVKEGPKWKRNANKKGRTTVTINF